MKKKHNSDILTCHGFTLVELMITLVIASLIAGALYSTYILQQRSYTNQGQVTEMQQNVRVGVDFLTLDLRMAGYDPMASNIFGITAANSNSISFTADMDGDGALGNPATENEYFSFALSTYTSNGKTIPTLCRSATKTLAGASCQPMADYIEQIEFYYHFENGSAPTLTPGTLGNIRSVQVSILARAAKPDTKYTNNITYTTASGATWGPSNDNFRRRLIITHIDLRNMGL